MIADPFDDRYSHLKDLPDSVLRDLGRNDSAQRDYRKFAVELLWTRKSPYVRHTDLQQFVAELEAEFEGIQFDFPAPEIVEAKPMTCGVTIATMSNQEVIDNETEPVSEEVETPAEAAPVPKRKSGAKKYADS